MAINSPKISDATKKEIQVFLATHNRPHLIYRSIDSILNQTFGSFELIISDNSTNDETKMLIDKKYDNQIKYIKREPSVEAIAHLNLILKDVTSEYFMIFHDDDVMHDNMLEVLYKKIIGSDEIIAVGVNARIIQDEKPTKRNFYRSLTADIKITNQEQMVITYLNSAFVPFPSYLYKNEVAQQLRFVLSHGGKHCDAAFVIDLLSLGSVLFLSNPLMDYYRHEDQDSGFYNFSDFSKLINYISRKLKYNRNHPVIKKFRIQNIYGDTKYKLAMNKISFMSTRYCNIVRILFMRSPFAYFPKIIFLTFYYKFFKSNTCVA